MQRYQFYTIGQNGHIQGPPAEVESSGDKGALDKAKGLLDGNDIEVREGQRLVAYLVPDDN